MSRGPVSVNICNNRQNRQGPLRDVGKKKRENVGILKKTGGGLPESHFHFLLFLTWETPPKMQKKT